MAYRTAEPPAAPAADVERATFPRYTEGHRRVVRWVSGVPAVLSLAALFASDATPVRAVAGTFVLLGLAGLWIDRAYLRGANTIVADYDAGLLHINGEPYGFATIGEVDIESADEGDLELVVLVRGDERTVVARAMPPFAKKLAATLNRLRRSWEQRQRAGSGQA